MLNYIEMSELWQFTDGMPESREKDLLKRLLFEYEEYSKLGTHEECRQRKEWMSYSPEQIRALFADLAKHHQEEKALWFKSQPELKIKKKRGRPPKISKMVVNENE